jgi:hypothetical protein
VKKKKGCFGGSLMMWRGVVFARVNARVCHVPLQTSFTDDSPFTVKPHFIHTPLATEGSRSGIIHVVNFATSSDLKALHAGSACLIAGVFAAVAQDLRVRLAPATFSM